MKPEQASTAAKQRTFAVAQLRRATSLPQIQGSRGSSPHRITLDDSTSYTDTIPPLSTLTKMPNALEVLQKGSYWSNSAAVRMIARQELALITPTSASSRPRNMLSHERSVARERLLRKLAERTKEESVEEQISEDDEVGLPPPNLKRRRRRSRRRSADAYTTAEETKEQRGGDGTVLPPTPRRKRRQRRSRGRSAGSSTAAEEMACHSTGDSTPLLPATPSSIIFDRLLVTTEPAPCLPSKGLHRTASAPKPFHPSEPVLPKVDGAHKPLFREPLTVVVDGGANQRKSSHIRLPQYNPVTLPTNLDQVSKRESLASDTPSVSSTESSSRVPVPVYLSTSLSSGQQSPLQNMFPTSHFGTPLTKGAVLYDEDQEPVMNQENVLRGKFPFYDACDHEVSWIAEPGESTILRICFPSC